MVSLFMLDVYLSWLSFEIIPESLGSMSYPQRDEKDLRFWLTLLNHPGKIHDDDTFQFHLQYFREVKCPLQRARDQQNMLEPFNGIHYTPMRNMEGLLDLLQTPYYLFRLFLYFLGKCISKLSLYIYFYATE